MTSVGRLSFRGSHARYERDESCAIPCKSFVPRAPDGYTKSGKVVPNSGRLRRHSAKSIEGTFYTVDGLQVRVDRRGDHGVGLLGQNGFIKTGFWIGEGTYAC